MTNKSRGSRAAAAAMVMAAVLVVSAVSAEAAVVKKSAAAQKQQASALRRISDAYASLKSATANFMLRWYDALPDDLPFTPVPRELTR